MNPKLSKVLITVFLIVSILDVIAVAVDYPGAQKAAGRRAAD